MKRYLVHVYRYDGKRFTVFDRVKNKKYYCADTPEAFEDYPGTIQELAQDIDFTEESMKILNRYGKAYKIGYNDFWKRPYLFMELNDAGKYKRHNEKIWSGHPCGPMVHW